MDTNRSVVDLFTDLVGQMTTLVRKEIQLAKAEFGQKASDIGAAAGKLGAGGVLMLAGLIMFLHAVVAWLAYAGLEPRWGTLLVAVLVLAGGYLALRTGLSAMKATNLKPVRTTEQLQRDAAVAREQLP